ncbi:hypothetical protein [Undibacterium oligocarboniphilum]|uniref:Uncharacterized protein n=1 Tax=Undibacterium oligocarboniphilum TaxID=666702 RepID=A0A850QPW3_9BURK|nr:hypothetical protein [Undibacterium oligocarboniphilum]MBC3871737.1 hypothetical protein [Undibacterium oligocarboniphilum]NVO79373.1 hypothetical protein [Undibacterium oligocarboniphilum]
MNTFSKQFDAAIACRTGYILYQIFNKHGVNSPIDDADYCLDAFLLAFTQPYSQLIENYFDGTPLKESYISGYQALQNAGTDMDCFDSGTLEEYLALSDEEKQDIWEEFHSKCAQGVADELYFYHVLMAQWLEGYVGH